MACNPEGAMDRRINQFEKICTLNAIAGDIIVVGEEQGLLSLRVEVDETCGTVPEGNFEDVVDLSAPHPSLQRLMEIAEYRFAMAVTAVLARSAENMDIIRELCSAVGETQKIDAEAEINDAFTWFEMNVLDGMPCDQTKGYFEEGNDQLKWEKLMDTHEEAWQKAGSDVAIYYELQKCYVNGMFSDSKIRYDVQDGMVFTLTMEQ